ncbi:MAG: glycosyltransferase family 4 protein [Flavobacteriaceae bacterium]
MVKILCISIPSVHFIRWISMLEGHYELYYYNDRDMPIKYDLPENCKLIEVKDYKSIRPFKGEVIIKRKNAKIYQLIDNLISFFYKSSFEKIIKKLNPDIVHAFELNTSAYPILSVMNRYKKLPFVYSIWGSDIYFFKNLKTHEFKIREVLKRVNYLFADCDRDYKLARDYNFSGIYLGTIPGGGGFNMNEYKDISFSNKENLILIKGYENQFGRGINILKALLEISDVLKEYKIIVFSANEKLIAYFNSEDRFQKMNIDIIAKDKSIEHAKMLKLYSKAKIYIGNSITDGLPNTLLEAISFGVFPIQSNPGGVSSEVINHTENGFLIEDPNDIKTIATLIKEAIADESLLKKATVQNLQLGRDKFEFNHIKKLVLDAYKSIHVNA